MGKYNEMQVSVNIPVTLANVDCDGDETSLLVCSSSPPMYGVALLITQTTLTELY